MSWHLKLIQSLTEELEDMANDLTARQASIIVCSQHIWEDLRSIAQNLSTKRAIQSSCASLDLLIDKTYREITSMPSARILTGWLRVYTDACILRSLANLGPSTAAESIARLDSILITCGSASGRVDLINSIITNVQRTCFTPNTPTIEHAASPIGREHQSTRVSLESSGTSISSYSKAPSILHFQSNLHNKPFVVRGYADDWPAINEHPWKSAAYLRTVSGPGRVVPVEVGKDYRKADWTQELMSWDDFLANLELADQPSSSRKVTAKYLAQHDLSLQFPPLRADIIVPDYVYASMTGPELTDYQPPKNEEGFIINMWLGPEGTMSPAHTDPYHNLFVQIVGQKTVWLAPPKSAPFMYTLSSKDHGFAANSTELRLGNTSRVDVFSAKGDEFPQFWQEVVLEAESAVLEPGDLLYIPIGWWHALRSETTSFSVSIWF